MIWHDGRSQFVGHRILYLMRSDTKNGASRLPNGAQKVGDPAAMSIIAAYDARWP
jgi:hypothetical protein